MILSRKEIHYRLILPIRKAKVGSTSRMESVPGSPRPVRQSSPRAVRIETTITVIAARCGRLRHYEGYRKVGDTVNANVDASPVWRPDRAQSPL